MINMNKSEVPLSSNETEPKPETVTMYCVKCGMEKIVTNAQEVILRNGDIALIANCPSCERVMYLL